MWKNFESTGGKVEGFNRSIFSISLKYRRIPRMLGAAGEGESEFGMKNYGDSGQQTTNKIQLISEPSSIALK